MTSATTAIARRAPPVTPAISVKAGASPRLRKLLLVCGIFSSLLYVVANIVGAMVWKGYDSVSQTISELVAVDAPSKSTVASLFIAYDVFLIAFGAGVWRSAGRKRALRVTASLLVGIGAIGLAWPFAPMHQREALAGGGATLTDTMHIVLAIVTVLLIVFAIGSAATAFGKRFRLYSIGTILLLVVSGALAALEGPRIASNLPTPWAGITERINLGIYLSWVVVLAGALWRK